MPAVNIKDVGQSPTYNTRCQITAAPVYLVVRRVM